MCIQRSVLNHYIFRHTDTERSKIPYGFNAACHHRIRNFLRNLNRYCQHTDIDVICLHFLFKIIGMIDWNAIQCCPYQIGIYIKCCHNLQTEMVQTGISQQCTTQTSHTEKKCFMYIGKSQKIFQHGNQRIYLIPHTGTAGNIDI